MGRFRITEEEHDDHDDGEHAEDGCNWEFVAEPGSEGAMVARDTAVSASASNSDPPAFSREDDHLADTNQRAESSSLSHEQFSDWLGDHYYRNDANYESRSKIRWWFWILLAAVVIQIAVLYAPPAPPPMADDYEHEDWQAFLLLHTQQVRESVTALVYHTPTHIGRWWMLRLVSDVQQWYHDWKLPSPCRLRVPTGNSDDKFVLDQFQFGQIDAVDVVTDAIQAWEPESSPLLIYLAGMKGVGKTTLARALAKQLFPKECSADGLESSIATIDAGDFADTNANDSATRYVDETPESVTVRMQSQLAQTIVRHVQRLDGGIVILQDVDRMAPALLVWLCRELRGLNIAGDLSAVGTRPSLGILEHCRKVVFVFLSSSAGAKTIMKSIRTYGGKSNIPRPGLLLDMLHEIDTHFDASSMSISDFFHAVAPLFPLGKQDLSHILRHKVDNISQSGKGLRWSHLTITDAAIEALLDPSQIEYVSWKQVNNPASPPLLTFSSTGASALQEGTPLMNKLKSKIKVCFAGSTAGAQPDRVAVINYFPFPDEIAMQWCSPASSSSSSSAASSASGAALDNEWKPPCEVTCRYKI
jgi:hypothetical protein